MRGRRTLTAAQEVLEPGRQGGPEARPVALRPRPPDARSPFRGALVRVRGLEKIELPARPALVPRRQLEAVALDATIAATARTRHPDTIRGTVLAAPALRPDLPALLAFRVAAPAAPTSPAVRGARGSVRKPAGHRSTITCAPASSP